jgi:hypothetical protein
MARSQFDCRRRGVNHPTLLVVCLPLAEFLGRLPLLVAEFGDQRSHPGIDAGHQSTSSFPL